MALGDLFIDATGEELLTDLVLRWAEERPDAPAFTFVNYGSHRDGRRTTLTWAETHLRACATAARLRRFAAPGDRVALLLPQGLEYLTTMLGSMYARTIAVPLFSPDLPGRSARLAGAYADADPAVVVSTSAILPEVRAFLGDNDLPQPRDLVAADAIEPAAWDWERVDPEELAYLQYTSGSTREPAGVEISHHNLAVNARQLWTRFGVDRHRRVAIVSWLPLFHDMGLVATLAAPIVHGIQVDFTDPASYIRHPARWLRMISDRRDHEVLTAAPNFAYEYCLTRTRDTSGFDLRGLRWCLNGAEPVRQGTLDRFASTFSATGLRPGALTPCYGLAEATVFVTAACEDVPPRILRVDPIGLREAVVRPCETERGVGMVSCGRPAGQYVAIVDPETCAELPDDRIGEIWLHGPNVARGYWRKPERSREIFGGRLTDPAGGLPAGPWMRTGDLGIIHDGDLYIAGRIKDLIIIDGRNHFPQDVEATVQDAHPAVRSDHVAAFAIDGADTEHLVVVAERSRTFRIGELDHDEVRNVVRGAVGALHDVWVHDFVLVRPGGVPRTSSGKIARSACRQLYLASRLPTVQE
ncbi:fatty acyl-AMP ligase [Nonomuraea sp. NPDC026600]|uniref:fatty acyl-AMP ligase n=1 Tax=Nonomuraea sp. NPDC026600 TaxID=3155363 RepID=UPI0033E23612